MSQLDQLSKHTVIVADTGDIDSIRKFQPQDATTNPSLMLQAASDVKFAHLVDQAIEWGATQTGDVLGLTMDKLSVIFGTEILSIVPGVVSTEVDARLSFDTQATIDRARRLIAMYEENGINRSRVLIKIASTWEGIKAAETLEKEGITCNLTLLFGFCQAVACAEANVTLISPFVGRILDWYKSKGNTYEEASADPGVISVTKIYNYYKQFGYKTVVMGASFRNTGEIIELTGCDKLTISPKLLTELQENNTVIVQKLAVPENVEEKPTNLLSETEFRWMLNEDPMATEKLSEGIRNFAIDCVKLENVVKAKLEAKGLKF